MYINAQSYENEICIKGLPAFMNGKTVCYELDLGYTILNTLEKKTFTLTNTSVYHAYKFEIFTNSNLIVLPRIGHLKSMTSKDIVVTFSSKEPIHIKKVSTVFIKGIELYLK